MRLIEINTSTNTPDGAWWHIHRVGCADVQRTVKKFMVEEPYEIEVANVDQYIAATVKELNDQDGNDESNGFSAENFRVFPCVGGQK